MLWLLIVAIILIGLTGLYSLEMRKTHARTESFADYIQVPRGPDGPLEPDLAIFGQGLPLADMLAAKPSMAPSDYDAAGCAAIDDARQLELGGQYVQRTNNYKHTYPDNCSSPLSDFVGAIYVPVNGVGQTVPCDGQC